MDKIYLKMMLAQSTIDIIYNSYQRRQTLVLSNEDICDFLDFFINILEGIEKEIITQKLVKPALIEKMELYPNWEGGLVNA